LDGVTSGGRFATLADQLGLSMGQRQALMGHSRAAMTMQYTHTPGEQARAALEQLAEKVKWVVN
jgi:integrase